MHLVTSNKNPCKNNEKLSLVSISYSVRKKFGEEYQKTVLRKSFSC